MTLNVRWLDEEMNIHDVISGNGYEDGLTIYTQLINASNQIVKLRAKYGEDIIEEVVLDEKPEDDDASYGGLQPIELTEDLTYELEYFKAHKIIIHDAINSEYVTLNIRWLDEEMNIHDIQSEDVIEEGTMIYTQLINASDRKARLILKDTSGTVDNDTVTQSDIFAGSPLHA